MGFSETDWKNGYKANLIMDEKKELRHIGIIMDGNGRWAKSRGLPRLIGHREGMKAVEQVIRAANDLGVPYLSLYAFSTENWGRPKAEVKGLMELLKFYINAKIKELNIENVRILFAGDLSEMPRDVLPALCEAERLTSSNTGLTLIICLNYGGRSEILNSVNALLKDGVKPPVTEADLRKHFYLPDIPDPDLLIRTSGELRMSNFWLWQGAYSEYYFIDKHWPDFNGLDLETAIKAYHRRDRRYGKI